MGWGYTCFVNAFAIFVSDREIKPMKSGIIQLFNDINTEEAFLGLKLPIKEVSQCPGEANVGLIAWEIDCSSH